MAPVPVSEQLAVLAQTLTAMASAAASDTVIALASRAATDLADADGICLMGMRQNRCVYTMSRDPRPIQIRLEDSPFQHLAAAVADPAARLRDGAPEDCLVTPSGQVQSLATLQLVPLVPPCGWNVLGVFWSTRYRPNLAETQALSALGSGLSLALQVRLKEQELMRSGQRHKYLMGELQHRVRNILAFVRSIVRRTGETAESAEEFALHLESRIGALARAQSTLVAAGPNGVELEDLVRAEMTATAMSEDRMRITGPPIRLHGRGAETIAMALHELATNSLKFGALTSPHGRIAVSWQTDRTVAPPRLQVSWVESGVKIAALAPRRRGFGQELIERTLPYELNALTRFTLLPGGVHCVIDVPVNERTASPSALGQLRDRNEHGTSNTAR